MVVKLTSNVSHKFEQTDTTYCKRITRQISLSSNNSELEEGESLDSLESIHVYALSNLLCRPIIVVSDNFLKDADGRDVAPIPFGGIYLPLEQDIKKCFKYPLVLAYESSHFSALVPADGDDKLYGEKLSSSVPLQAKDLSFLPVKYAIDPGSSWDMVQDDSMKEERAELTLQEKILLLRKYLDVVKVPSKPAPPRPEKNLLVGNVITHVNDILIVKSENTAQPATIPQSDIMIVAAKLNLKNRPKHYKEMIQNFIDNKMAEAKERKEMEIIEKRCPNCKLDGIPKLNGYCEWCYERSKIVTGKPPSPKPKSPVNTLVRRTNNILLNDQVDNPKKPPQQTSPILKRKSSFLSLKKKESSKQCEQKPALSTIKSLQQPNIYYPPSMEKKTSGTSAVGTGLDLKSTSLSRKPKEQVNQTVVSAPSTEEFKPSKHCKANGCKFYGSDKTFGFCSSCYRHEYNSCA